MPAPTTNDPPSVPPPNATDDDTTSIPSNANANCVGPTSSTAGKNSACAGCPNQTACSTGQFSSPAAKQQRQAEADNIRTSLTNVSHIVLVLSGKGGVGKSTIAAQTAWTLSSRGYNVGVLDVDICGPSLPRMVGVHGREVHQSASGWCPVYANPNLAVMSVSFLLPDADAAVVWRGPRKNGMIKQFLTETDWGSGEGLDYLIVDTPPGTSDEHISTVQLLQSAIGAAGEDSLWEGDDPQSVGFGALLVTTPEEVSMADVRKELNFCQKTKVKVLGVVENMATLKMKVSDWTFHRKVPGGKEEQDEEKHSTEECTAEVLELLRSKCPEVLDMVASADVFAMSGHGPKGMAERYGVPYMGALPLDPNLLKACEEGVCFVESYPESPSVGPLNSVVDRLVKALPVEEVDMEEG